MKLKLSKFFLKHTALNQNFAL